jgi:excisionase family DNA binding protein
MDKSEGESGLDLLWGVGAIARELGLSNRQTYHLLENGRLPAQKVGAKWCSSRNGLRKHFKAAVCGESAGTEHA